MKNTDFDLNEIREIKQMVEKDSREFGDWFRKFCPAERLVSGVEAALTCRSCKYNSGSDIFNKRCYILNTRKKTN